MSLFNELKRRNVFRVGIAYSVVAWLAAQVLQLVLNLLAEAIDGGMIVSTKISREFLFFQELDGNPEYEAIQAGMFEHLNSERQKLGLEPVST